MSTVEKCAICGATKELLRCSYCKSVRYCGVDHQREHWKAHKPICKAIRKKAAAAKLAAEQAAASKAADVDEGEEVGEETDLFDDNAIDTVVFSKETRQSMIPFPLSELSVCGIHRKHDEGSKYAHALNNMAGSHRIFSPLSNDTDLEDFGMIGVRWQRVPEDYYTGNGLIFKADAHVKNAHSEVGSGMRVRGTVCIEPVDEALQKETLVLDGEESFKYTFDKDGVLLTNEEYGDLVVHPGASFDGCCVLRGPLTYFGMKIGEDGGVHWNGCAFAKNEYGRYYELCVEDETKEQAEPEPTFSGETESETPTEEMTAE